MPVQKVFNAKTGTGVSEIASMAVCRDVIAFCRFSYGATPTITIQLEGSADGETWILTGTALVTTTGTPKIIIKGTGEVFPLYRLNITANTNVTVDEAWIIGDEPAA